MTGDSTSQPSLRVLTLDHVSDYHRIIYDRLNGLVIDAGLDNAVRWERLDRQLEGVDIFHLHWPEWLLAPDIELHRRFAAALRRAAISVVWSQHNLTPHSFHAGWADIYQFWAQAADGVIHHSDWGMTKALAAHRYRAECQHIVVHHPHFGPLAKPQGTRREIEASLGWRSDVLRLTVIGRPRTGKLVTYAIDAFTRCRRPDLELRVFSLAASERSSADSRVFAEPYSRVDRAIYDQRLAASDALIMPFHQTSMLTTGTVADAVAHELPCLVSDWAFLTETLGDAAIVYGSQPMELLPLLDKLGESELARASAVASALKDKYDPEVIARTIYSFLQDVRQLGTTALAGSGGRRTAERP
jgi:glycosyltransferase involved in cell wall biosynthesis